MSFGPSSGYAVLPLAAFLALTVAATGQSPSAKKAEILKPNIILITIDTTRADHMGFLGSDRGVTPNLDAVATDAIVFTRAYAQVPLTTASHAAILTGTYPQFNHVNDFGTPLREGLPYLPAILHQHGYRTAAFVGSIALDPASGAAPGFDRGFDFYDAGFHSMGPMETRYESVERRAEYVVADAMNWLKKQRAGAPFFMWVHLYDPHDPYEPPEPYKSKFADAYDGEIAYADAMLGKLFAALHAAGWYDGATIAIMSDHGEAFGEHGERTHGVFLYDETIHVPLLVKLPNSVSGVFRGMTEKALVEPSAGQGINDRTVRDRTTHGRKIEQRVGLIDVTPTILESVGIAIPAEVQGQSLLSLLKPDAPVTNRAIYSESDYPFLEFHWSALRALRTDRYLYVEAPKQELYDQNSDPRAVTNLALSFPAIAEALRTQTAAFFRNTSSQAVGEVQVDPQRAAKLGALGYLASDIRTAPEIKVGGADPKDHIEAANLFHDGLIDLEEKRYQKAVGELEEVVEREPTSGLAYSELGTAWIRLKNFERALPVMRRAVELRPEFAMNQYQLGQALLQTGGLQESVGHFEKAVQLLPSADYHFALATIYVRLNREEEAMRQVDEALAVEPHHYRANLLRGVLLADDKPAEAFVNLRAAAAERPDESEPHEFMAKAYEHMGDKARADEERLKAKELREHR